MSNGSDDYLPSELNAFIDSNVKTPPDAASILKSHVMESLDYLKNMGSTKSSGTKDYWEVSTLVPFDSCLAAYEDGTRAFFQKNEQKTSEKLGWLGTWREMLRSHAEARGCGWLLRLTDDCKARVALAEGNPRKIRLSNDINEGHPDGMGVAWGIVLEQSGSVWGRRLYLRVYIGHKTRERQRTKDAAAALAAAEKKRADEAAAAKKRAEAEATRKRAEEAQARHAEAQRRRLEAERQVQEEAERNKNRLLQAGYRVGDEFGLACPKCALPLCLTSTSFKEGQIVERCKAVGCNQLIQYYFTKNTVDRMIAWRREKDEEARQRLDAMVDEASASGECVIVEEVTAQQRLEKRRREGEASAIDLTASDDEAAAGGPESATKQIKTEPQKEGSGELWIFHPSTPLPVNNEDWKGTARDPRIVCMRILENERETGEGMGRADRKGLLRIELAFKYDLVPDDVVERWKSKYPLLVSCVNSVMKNETIDAGEKMRLLDRMEQRHDEGIVWMARNVLPQRLSAVWGRPVQRIRAFVSRGGGGEASSSAAPAPAPAPAPPPAPAPAPAPPPVAPPPPVARPRSTNPRDYNFDVLKLGEWVANETGKTQFRKLAKQYKDGRISREQFLETVKKTCDSALLKRAVLAIGIPIAPAAQPSPPQKSGADALLALAGGGAGPSGPPAVLDYDRVFLKMRQEGGIVLTQRVGIAVT